MNRFSRDPRSKEKSRAKAAGISVWWLWLCACASLFISVDDWEMEQVCACELEIENEGQSLCVCVWVCVCLSAPMRQDLQSVKWSREDFSRDTLQHISPSLSFALSPIPPPSTPSSLCLHFSVLPCYNHFNFQSLLPLLALLLLAPLLWLTFHLFHFLNISLSLLYSAALSLRIKLSLLWSLFFPLLALYLTSGCRVCAES